MTIRPLHTPLLTPPAERAERTASAPSASAETASAETASLSEAERQALAHQFPENETLMLRLYRPSHSPDAPAPLGTRLDLRG